jgi:cytochrome c peroxidase
VKHQAPNFKPAALHRLALVLGVWMFSGCWGLGFGASLLIEITPKISGELLQSTSLRYETYAKEAFSITRLSYLLSGFALQRPDGSWLELTNQIAWFDMEGSRSTHHIAVIPAGEYCSIRFHVGLDEKLNHANPAQFAPDHPLNPNRNGLHWNWQGGYIFLALEGMWRNASGTLDGWSYHFARDPNRTRITIATALNLTNDAKLELDFDLATLLNAPRPLAFGRDGSSTHSREGDPVAGALAANLPGAFRVHRISAQAAELLAGVGGKPLYLPAQFTPYRFHMSATFPIPDLPRDNPLIEERVGLGEQLFKEKLLSKDNLISCASCHEEKHAFTDPRRYSVGVRGQKGARNGMPLFNLAWKRAFFWDGRAPSLRAQALLPIQDHTEMDEALTNVVAKLGAQPNYPARFTAAFGAPEITPEKIGLAIENYLLTLTSFDSKFDRTLKGAATLTAEEQRGLQLFMTEYDPRREQFGADCFHCHGGALFQSQSFANNGLDDTFPDPGHTTVTGKESDQGKFSTPSLRNIALTAPYMHDGRFATLVEVVEHYSTGVKRSATLDPNLAKHPDGGIRLSKEDQAALVAFLLTLTDEKYLN